MVLTAVLYGITLLVMLVGVVGAFVPALPGTSLILVAIVGWGLLTGFSAVSWALLTALIVLLLSAVVGYLAAYVGAQKVGASRWGQIGAAIGLCLGFVGLLPALPVGGPLLGLLLGAMVGAFVGEFWYRRDLALTPRCQLASKVSLAIVVGSLVGNLLEGLLAIAAVGVFVVTTWPFGGG